MTNSLKNPPSLKATIIGQAALLIWAMSASGAVALSALPAFEILSGLFISGFISSSIMNTTRGNWKNVTSRPKYLLLAGIVGIIGNDIFYILAFKYAPAVHVSLISCLWPMLVLILATIVLNENIRLHHMLACLLGFSGVYVLLTTDTNVSILKKEYWFGYLCAFASAILWSIYMTVSRKYAKLAPELFSIYCGIGSIFSITIHLGFEVTVIPSFTQGMILLIMGVTTHSIAYYGWDFAIKKGNFKLLNILPYGNPVLSVLALIFFGFAELTEAVFISTLMVSIAGIIGGARFKKKAPENATETVSTNS